MAILDLQPGTPQYHFFCFLANNIIHPTIRFYDIVTRIYLGYPIHPDDPSDDQFPPNPSKFNLIGNI